MLAALAPQVTRSSQSSSRKGIEMERSYISEEAITAALQSAHLLDTPESRKDMRRALESVFGAAPQAASEPAVQVDAPLPPMPAPTHYEHREPRERFTADQLREYVLADRRQRAAEQPPKEAP